MSTKSHNSVATPYLTVVQAAERLSVHPSTIRRWIDLGRLPAYRLGQKRIGVREADLARLVSLRPARQEPGPRLDRTERPVMSPLTKEQQRRGLQALNELGRLSAMIAGRHGQLTPDSWVLLNQARDDRTEDLMGTIGG